MKTLILLSLLSFSTQAGKILINKTTDSVYYCQKLTSLRKMNFTGTDCLILKDKKTTYVELISFENPTKYHISSTYIEISKR